MTLEFAMLDENDLCIPGFEDTSGGHTTFKHGPFKLRLVGPSSNAFDEIQQPFERDKWVAHMVEQFKRDDHTLRCVFEQLFDMAKAHCDEHHKDLRERFKR
jgi:hypothetical protein